MIVVAVVVVVVVVVVHAAITVASTVQHDPVDGGNMYNGGEPLLGWDYQLKLVQGSTDAFGAEDASYRYHQRTTQDTVGGHRWRR